MINTKKIKHTLSLILALTLLSFSLATPVLASNGEQNQFSNEVGSIPQKIEDYIEMCKSGTASVSIAVFNSDETIYQTYYGYANIEDEVPVDEDTVYEWGSATKLITWVSVMQLYEQGKIDLSEDIRSYLPDGFLSKLKYDEPITMMHLMNHTAGFQEIVYGDDVERTDASLFISLEHSLRQSQPSQIYKPGEVCSYSNWGTALAAYIVERISGQSFDEYVGEHIFSVLGMEQTAILPDWSDNRWVQEKRKELNCYSIFDDSFESYGQRISHVFLYPAGAAAGTLNDFMKFSQALIPDNVGSPLFEKPDTLTEFLTPTLFFFGTDVARNYHGLWTMPYGNGVIGHSGNTKGCTSSFYFDPESNTGVVIMTNEQGETAYNYGLLGVVFGEYKYSSDFTVTDDISGVYTSSRGNFPNGFLKANKYTGGFFTLSKTDDPAVYSLPMGQGTFTQISDNLFIMDNGNGLSSLYAKKVTEDGTLVFETMSQDVILENNVTYIPKIALLISFFIAVIYAVIMLCINGISAIVKALKKKKVNLSHLNVFRIMSYFSMVATGICMYMLLFTIDAEILHVQTTMNCILISVFSLIPCVYSVWQFIKKDAQKKQKISLVVTAIMAFLMLFNVVFWQWFNFWSF